MMPRIDMVITLGNLLTMLTVLLAAFAWLSQLRDEQKVHRAQLAAITVWIDRHDRDLRENLALLQELRTQLTLTAKLLEVLTERVERVETWGGVLRTHGK